MRHVLAKAIRRAAASRPAARRIRRFYNKASAKQRAEIRDQVYSVQPSA